MYALSKTRLIWCRYWIRKACRSGLMCLYIASIDIIYVLKLASLSSSTSPCAGSAFSKSSKAKVRQIQSFWTLYQILFRPTSPPCSITLEMKNLYASAQKSVVCFRSSGSLHHLDAHSHCPGGSFRKDRAVDQPCIRLGAPILYIDDLHQHPSIAGVEAGLEERSPDNKRVERLSTGKKIFSDFFLAKSKWFAFFFFYRSCWLFSFTMKKCMSLETMDDNETRDKRVVLFS